MIVTPTTAAMIPPTIAPVFELFVAPVVSESAVVEGAGEVVEGATVEVTVRVGTDDEELEDVVDTEDEEVADELEEVAEVLEAEVELAEVREIDDGSGASESARTMRKSRKSGSDANLLVTVSVCTPSGSKGDWKKA